jgi:hypothetical protein
MSTSLKKGQRVKISKSSEYYTKNQRHNPRGVVGTIVDNHSATSHKYKVKWDNGSTNTYREEDLVLAGLEIGNRVMIAKSSEYYKRDTSNNPRGVEGTIINDKHPILNFKYKVQWDNGGHNSYREGDLVLAENLPTVKAAPVKPTPVEKKTLHAAVLEALNIKVGDTVKVCFAVPSHHGDWKNSWVGEMNQCIGKIGTVTQISPLTGVELSFPDGGAKYDFPAFALKQKQIPNSYVKLNKEYKATVNFNTNQVEVGCQKIDFAQVEELYKVMKSKKS